MVTACFSRFLGINEVLTLRISFVKHNDGNGFLHIFIGWAFHSACLAGYALLPSDAFFQLLILNTNITVNMRTGCHSCVVVSC